MKINLNNKAQVRLILVLATIVLLSTIVLAAVVLNESNQTNETEPVVSDSSQAEISTSLEAENTTEIIPVGDNFSNMENLSTNESLTIESVKNNALNNTEANNSANETGINMTSPENSTANESEGTIENDSLEIPEPLLEENVTIVSNISTGPYDGYLQNNAIVPLGEPLITVRINETTCAEIHRPNEVSNVASSYVACENTKYYEYIDNLIRQLEGRE